MKKTLLNIAFVIAFLGLLDAGYLTYLKLFSLPIPCTITHGCETVIRSSYSVVLGVPLAIWGLIFYIGMLVLSVLYVYKESGTIRKLFHAGTIVGALASSYFIYLQAAVIQAWCQYCLVSAFLSYTLGVLSIWIACINKKEKAAQSIAQL